MKNRFTAAIMAVALAVPAIADASPTKGLYLGMGAGAGLQQDMEAESAGVTNIIQFEKPSVAAFGAIGYGFGNNFRVEVESSYRRSTVGEVTGTGSGNAVGTFNAVGILANVLYDFNLNSALKPYVGVGAGGAMTSADAGSVFTGDSFDDNPFHLAFQGIAGMAFQLNDQLDVTLDYRYFRALEQDYDLASGATAAAEYTNHSVMLGFRYEFFSENWRSDDWAEGQAKKDKTPRRESIREVVELPQTSPPAAGYPYSQTPVYRQGTSASPVPIYTPPKPSAPVEFPPPVIVSGSPELYVVYFDYNRYDLSLDSKDTLVRAAAAFKNGGMARVVVSGHTDAAGSSRYNKRLSQRRADTVKQQLAKLGVPKDVMITKAKGEEDPPVPTADGAKEAKNRRAEIVMN